MTRRRWLAYAVALAGPPVLVYALRPLASGDQATNVAFVLLLVVLAAASLGGLGPGVLASVSAFAAFDLVFVEPRGRLSVAAAHDAGVLVGFVGTALVVSALVASLARDRARAERHAEDARLLARLSAAADDEDLAALVALATADLGAAAVVVGTGPPYAVLDPGGRADAAAVLRSPPHGAVSATASLADGETLHVHVLPSGTPAERHLVEGVTAVLAASVDRARLRDERRDRELLERTEQQRAALLAAVSHDLRTPLAAITVSASALAGPDLGDEDRESLRSSIAVEAERLDRLVRNLLELGRIEGGRLVAKPEPVPVDELVGGLLARLRPQLTDRRVELHIPGDLPPALVDPVQGEQSLGNLVENVLVHTPRNAGLIVRAAARGGWVTIRVADEGPGIEAQVRDRLFDRFARGSDSGRGAGLGLAIARAYAEANGGGLDLVPSACGAAFDLWFPAAS
jgi:two-component system sensor histidine kinase KdpD